MRSIHKKSCLYYGAIALLSLLFLCYFGTMNGFWYDEFAQVVYSAPPNTLLDTLKIADPTPPLFSLAANVWMRLVPMEEQWLLLLPQLAMSGAVVLMGLWCEKFYGVLGGLLGAGLLAFSQMVVEQCGFEFRGYGFYLFFATLTFFLHGEKKTVAYTLSLVGLAYCHIFGVGICVILGIWDGMQILQNKRVWKEILPYGAAGLIFLPWWLYFLAQAGTSAAAATGDWMIKPTLWDVVKLITYLCGNHIVVCLLFALGCLLALRELAKHWSSPEKLGACLPMFVGVLLIGAVFLYGILRREQASLWVKRYFTGLFPCGVFLSVRGAAMLFHHWEDKKRWVLAGLLLTTLPVWCWRIVQNQSPFGIYHHREAAAVLQQEQAAQQPNTMLLSSLGQFGEGFVTLYFPSPPPEGWMLDMTEAGPSELAAADTLYVDSGFGEPNDRLQAYIDQNYQCMKSWEDIDLKRYDKR